MFRQSLIFVLLLAGVQSLSAKELISPTSQNKGTTMCAARTLRCEYLENPLGLDEPAPRLSWQMSDERRGARQSAYQILVARSAKALEENRGEAWDTGKVESDDSAHIVYRGARLESGKRYFWKVRVWDKEGKPSAWSAPAFWEMGVLEPSEWKAQWIGRDDRSEEQRESFDDVQWIWYPEGDPRKEAPVETRYLRREFEVSPEKKVASAVLFVAADDFFTSHLNGREMGAGGGWKTFARMRLEEGLRPGKNVLALTVKNYASAAGVAGLLKITYDDGSVERIPTGESWKASKEAPEGWQEAGYDDSAWKSAMALGNIGIEPWGKIDVQPVGGPATYLRRSFELSRPVKSARVHVSALGSYRLHVNGQRVGDDILTPDWTDFRKRASYQTYDVTPLVKNGENALGAILGDGWYASGLGWGLQRFCFGPPPTRLLVQMLVEFEDGTSQSIVTDGSWRTSHGAILRSELYAGETYDARLEQSGWDKPGFDDSSWRPADVLDSARVALSAQASPPIRILHTLRPKEITNPAPGVYVFDMGQNMVGWARLKVRGEAGTRVRMRFAEILKPDGNIYTENLRRAEVTDTYFLKGKGEETFEPHFTYHGFRYIELTGYPGKPDLETLTGCVFYTAAPESGSFECANEMVNQVYQNTVWGQRGNLESVPTDCPQRDERLGWMGDAQIFWRTACFNMDLASFTAKWMRDVIEAQSEEGGFSDVAPRVVDMADGAPAWGDAGVIVPWAAWLQYGDKRLVERCYPAMEKWMKYIHDANPNLLWEKRRNNDFGDWVPAYDAPTSKDVIATAYWALDARLMAEMARAIGREQDARRYEELFQEIKKAFVRAYVKPDGEIGNGSQTCYLLALSFGLLSDDQAASATKLLAQDIEKRGGHLATGFVGTTYLMPVLSENGLNDVAYRLLLNEDYPSWGYMVRKGATTIWERWNGDKGDPAMNSYNHYAFGVVAEWLFRHVAGIDTDPQAPGYKRIVLRPYPNKRLGFARARYDSLYGTIASEWKYAGDGTLELGVTIPANTSARVHVPAAAPEQVRESGKAISQDSEIRFLKMEDGYAVYELGAGSYRFSSSGVK